jgi:4-hydroxy 2-oxovalerate aldolase
MTKKKIKLLDCTLRDGGYYTNWDFDKSLVKTYCKSMESLPIDYVEIGYRSIPLEGYLGEYYYCPDFVMKELKEMMPSKKLVIILNEKDIRVSHVPELLEPCQGYISMVRIAIDPANFERAIELAKAIKVMGFEVAFNVMYMSKWKADNSFLDLLEGLDNTIDYFYMVDSFGGVFQEDVKEIISLVRSKTNVKLGFHGHNNLEMALANTITAMSEGCEIVDATITGMGRGAGNLRTELLLTYLNSKGYEGITFGDLSETVALFEDMKKDYGWGTNLPYMFSGAYSLPQKQVMEWVGMNRYPIASIVNALHNKKSSIDDNLSLPNLENDFNNKDVLIVGGGNSIRENKQALRVFLKQNKDLKVIHTGLKYISNFKKVENDQYYALVGFEGDKLLGSVEGVDLSNKKFVYPPHPRKMGTLIPKKTMALSYELPSIDFTKASDDSPLAIAIQLAINLEVDNVYFIGFDGYDTNINKSQFKLVQENQNVFLDFLKIENIEVRSLTPSKYQKLKHSSIYSLLK